MTYFKNWLSGNNNVVVIIFLVEQVQIIKFVSKEDKINFILMVIVACFKTTLSPQYILLCIFKLNLNCDVS